jgi:hypothetical protein
MLYFLKLGQTYPWNLLSNSDIKFDVFSAIPYSYFIFGIGPVLVLSIIGAFLILKKKDDLSLLIAPWSVIYILGYTFIWKLIHYNSQRFLQTPFYVFLGILTTITLVQVSKLITKYTRINQKVLIIIFTSIVILSGLSSLKTSLEINIDNFKWAADYDYYSTPEVLSALDWFEKNTKEKDIVLADKLNAELVSAMVGNFVFYNIHANELSNFNEIETTAYNFFCQRWDKEDALKFIIDQKIKYVLWSYLEQVTCPKKVLEYPFLTKVYENEKAIIYGIKLNP